MSPDVERAGAARDAAVSRLRRATIAATAGGAVLMAALAGLAAASTHARKVVRIRTQPRVRPHRLAPVRAPVPPLVAVPSAGSQGQQPSAPQAPAAPPASVPYSAPPVVVSGGS